jgi:hypothetical protein
VTLESIVADSAALADANLRARLEWLESAAAACEREALAEPAFLLRAALGAIVKFSRAPGDAAALGELEVVVKALTAKALLGLTTTLADTYGALAQKGGVHRAQCADASEAFRAMSRALQHGERVPASALEKMRALDATLRAT